MLQDDEPKLIVFRDFQDHIEGLSARWDFSGDPCPIEKYEWAIHRFDGTVILNMTELPAGRCTIMHMATVLLHVPALNNTKR